jgi:hypothetical protein
MLKQRSKLQQRSKLKQRSMLEQDKLARHIFSWVISSICSNLLKIVLFWLKYNKSKQLCVFLDLKVLILSLKEIFFAQKFLNATF